MIVTEGFLEEVGLTLGFEGCIECQLFSFTLRGQLITRQAGAYLTIAKLELTSIIIVVG